MKPNLVAHQCIRCDKHVYGIHTCQPKNKIYIAGLLEGLRVACDYIDREDQAREIDNLIKQYSGDE